MRNKILWSDETKLDSLAWMPTITSSIPVAVLMRASFIIALDGFCNCTWRNFQSSWNVQIDWPSCLKVMMDCRFSLLIWAVLAINMDLVFHQIGLSSKYHPYLVATQLIGWNALGRKEITQIHFLRATPVNWNAFQVTTSRSWLRECQKSAKLSSRQRVATLKNLKYILICLILFWLLHDSMCVFHSFDVFTIILQCRK